MANKLFNPKILSVFFSYEFTVLYWVFAYMVGLTFVRLVYGKLNTKAKNPTLFFITCSIFSIFFVWLKLKGENYLAPWFITYEIPFDFYNSFLTNFYTTLWIIFEYFLFLVYGYNIYRSLKNSIESNKSIGQRNELAYLFFFNILPTVAFLIIFFSYNYYSVVFYQKNGLHMSNLSYMLSFYKKICGFFWVLIEIAGAIIFYNIYKLIRKEIKGN